MHDTRLTVSSLTRNINTYELYDKLHKEWWMNSMNIAQDMNKEEIEIQDKKITYPLDTVMDVYLRNWQYWHFWRFLAYTNQLVNVW